MPSSTETQAHFGVALSPTTQLWSAVSKVCACWAPRRARHCPIARRGSSTEWTGLNWGCSWFTQGSSWENGVAQRRRLCHVKAAAALKGGWAGLE